MLNQWLFNIGLHVIKSTLAQRIVHAGKLYSRCASVFFSQGHHDLAKKTMFKYWLKVTNLKCMSKLFIHCLHDIICLFGIQLNQE